MQISSLTPELHQYLIDVSVQEHPVLQTLREETKDMQLSFMQIPPEQAQFMQFLIRLTPGKRVLELGTFTGYSALAMALAMPDDGHLLTCDINEEWTKHCHRYWKKAAMDHKITLKMGPALATLEQCLIKGEAGTYDFIFIDADKTNYLPYYELALKLLQPKGILLIDNIFWRGKVICEQETGAQVREIRKLNEWIKNDKRIFQTLVPIADGLFLIQLKPAFGE